MVVHDDSLADYSDCTRASLLEKHPQPHPNSTIPPAPLVENDFSLGGTSSDIAKAIRSFHVDLLEDELHDMNTGECCQTVKITT